ncbi:MAG: hypothetical protein Q8O86_01875 [Dehalococcoidia bacterium]|nr:hypothetical protein [Dehalococcoidia bacterium]
MARRQVLILYRGSLLAQGIASLLRQEEGLEVVSLQVGKEGPAPCGAGLDPYAIILDSNDLGGQAGLSVLGLLQEHPRAKVICLSAVDDGLEIYRKYQRTATRREELVEVIRST